jgi:hypothetical protein
MSQYFLTLLLPMGHLIYREIGPHFFIEIKEILQGLELSKSVGLDSTKYSYYNYLVGPLFSVKGEISTDI